jgi:hypothetical protein
MAALLGQFSYAAKVSDRVARRGGQKLRAVRFRVEKQAGRKMFERLL